jgi:hypothetical protein
MQNAMRNWARMLGLSDRGGGILPHAAAGSRSHEFTKLITA